MSIVATDLVAYGAASYPDDDTSLVGGAIDLGTKLLFTDIAATDSVEAVSDNAADTMNLTVRGRNAAGALVTETKALTGTTPISFATLGSIERFESATLASVAAGTVTIRRATDDATIATLEAGIDHVRRLFIEAASVAGSGKTYYEKFFVKNTHATLTLQDAEVQESADPSGLITFAVESAVNGSGTSANRLTAPASVSAFGGGPIAVPGNALAAGEAIGVWAKLTLADGNAAVETTWSPALAGTTV